jgi:hypothetical protein
MVVALDRRRHTRTLGDKIAVASGRDALAREPQLGEQLGEVRRARRQLIAVDDDLAPIVRMRRQGSLPRLSSGRDAARQFNRIRPESSRREPLSRPIALTVHRRECHEYRLAGDNIQIRQPHILAGGERHGVNGR